MAGNAINIVVSVKETGASVLSSLEKGMKNLQASTKLYHDTLNSLNGYVNGFNQNLRNMIGIVAGFNVAKSFIDTAASFEKTKLMLEGLMGSSEKADQAFTWIKDFATKTPFDIESVSNAFVKLKVSGIDPTSGALQILTDAVAAFGGGGEELKRLMAAISQMSGKGVVSMEELRQQVGEVLPTAMKVMAREMGISIEDLTARISSGSLEASVGIKALLTGLEKDYKGAGQRMMSGWQGIMQQMTSAWQALQDTLMKAGVFDALKKAIQNLTSQLKTEAFQNAARSLGTVIAGLAKDFVSVANTAVSIFRSLKPLFDIFLMFLPVIIKTWASWKMLSLSMGVIVGLPLSIYREVMALNVGFTQFMGIGIVGYVKNLVTHTEVLLGTWATLPPAMSRAVGSLGTLGLAFAAFWGVSKIAELVGVFKELGDAQEEIGKLSEKYKQDAKEFEKFKDVKVRSLQELKLMNEDQLQAEYNALQQSLLYWSKYLEGLRLEREKQKPQGSEDLWFVNEAGISAFSTEVDALGQQLQDTESKVKTINDEFSKFGQVARASGVDLKDFRDASVLAGKELEAGSGALKNMAISADDAKRMITELGQQHERSARQAANSFDFAAERAKASAENEKAAAGTVLEEYRRKKDYLIQMAEDTGRRQMEILNASKMKEKDYADEVFKINESMSQAKAKYLDDWLNQLKSTHIQALSAARQYSEQIKQIDKSILENQATGQQMLREIKRSGMTEEQAWNDRRKQAYEELRQAQAMIAQAGSPEELKEAIELAKNARSEFAGLSGEVKQGDQVVISQNKSMAEAARGVKSTTEAINEALGKQREMQEKNRETEVKRAKDSYEEWQKVQQLMEQIGQMKVTPEVAFEPNTSEVDQARERISKPISVPVTYDTSNAPSGGESGFRRGGQLPGWGGGDRIRALLEAGEFVIRKEAVSRYGSGLFHALNSMRLNLSDVLSSFVPRIPEMPKVAFATGGPVSAANYGTLRLQAGGVELPVQVAGPQGRDLVRQFEAALKKERLTKGR